MATILKGKYQFKQILSSPSTFMTTQIQANCLLPIVYLGRAAYIFIIGGNITPSDNILFQARLRYADDNTEVSVPGVYSSSTGWTLQLPEAGGLSECNFGGVFEIASDLEVSDAYYQWFNSNTIPYNYDIVPSAPSVYIYVEYGEDNYIAELSTYSNTKSVTLLCKDKTMQNDIRIRY